MQNQILNNNFGNLTKKKRKKYDIKEILDTESKLLDKLFVNSNMKLEKLTVIEAERRAALENLRTLTSLLQTKRLREKAKAANKYFTL